MDAALPSDALGQLLSAYLGGLATVLTPCIYPLIPVTLSLFGATANLSRWKAFLLSLSYVAGICMTYTVLGMFSAKTGALFGSTLGNPWIVLILSAFFIALALFSLEIIQLGFIGKLQNAASQIGGKGYSGAFLMGAVSGFVAAPCAGPILAVFLALAAESQNTAWGALLLFVYAFGFGSVFLVLGTFSNLTKNLPRAGTWMNGVKFLTSALLFGVVFFLGRPFFPAVTHALDTWLSHPILIGLAVGSLALGRAAYRYDSKALKLIACVALSLAVFQYFTGTPKSEHSSENAGHSQWLTSMDSALAAARSSNRIAMVDLYADWCAACKELDAHTFSNKAVQEKLKAFVLARLDFTNTDEEPQASIIAKYSVAGLPCILFLNGDGSEIADSRITGFLPPVDYLAHLQKIAP